MKRILSSVSIILLVLLVLSLVPSDYWLFRTWEYFLLQFLPLLLILLLGWGFFTRRWTNLRRGLTACTLLALGYVLFHLFPFFPFTSEELLDADRRDQVNDISLIVSNVYQHNDQHDKLVDLVDTHQPDLLLALETNDEWGKSLEVLHENYPYRKEALLDNTYGMLLYSKYPLHNDSIHYLVKPNVPSVIADIELPSGRLVRFYGLHPRPPVPGESSSSNQKDKELVLVGKHIRNHTASYRPVIVAGDLNDVGWSATSRLFRSISGLLDARHGRGFFNTFPVQVPLLRFPLDHIFCSNHFKLVELERLPSIGSDHYPLLVHLQSHQPFTEDQKVPKADSSDLQQAREELKNLGAVE